MAVTLRITLNALVFKANYVRLVEGRAIRYKNVAQVIYFLALYDLWRYSKRLPRMSALIRGTPFSKAII